MARPANTADSVQITVTLTPQQKKFLEAVSATGFVGKNVAETARHFLIDRINDLMTEGKLTVWRRMAGVPDTPL